MSKIETPTEREIEEANHRIQHRRIRGSMWALEARVMRKAKLLREKADVLLERQRLDMMKKGAVAGGVPEAFMVIGRPN